MSSPRTLHASALLAAGIDAALVLVFAAIGRASHGEDLLGVLTTWWPFLGGLTIGWLIMRAWHAPQRIVYTGLGVWLWTVAGGLLLRVVSGQGVQPSFIVVTAIVLGLFLVGWRGIAVLVRRVRARSQATTQIQ
ncbi:MULTISPECIES: DUF3054 domain-containing protein [unclassified Cryobacterium]|uniref:DUF3054 domain-containing protein n=1 Tax=unclassified Cryobacterium TaxID=2649013 RepID=UPI002AB3DDDB|nr:MULTISPECIES: DUF3054 domain-containing protein [unclassified Cryobacterium]MDY7541455.1 DUF3054 domain-containing protein [Cryobacterium sp. 5B3]MEA9999593.1 DUF3054 domain-containing protein [Cryobacterium sp. RTS3]MEB0265723.1 DUF3054 domain-containing protein [Cryobacterium sp. 10I5]MEB0274798.1 DUF3054 domain-containing protein [Cryobacterium sp. 5B3]